MRTAVAMDCAGWTEGPSGCARVGPQPRTGHVRRACATYTRALQACRWPGIVTWCERAVALVSIENGAPAHKTAPRVPTSKSLATCAVLVMA